MTTEVDDTTIAQLFARDPLKLSDQDITQVIEKLRSQRARFVLGNKKAGTPAVRKSAATKRQEKAMDQVGTAISLDDLGL